jgi:predicted transcriptional regulator
MKKKRIQFFVIGFVWVAPIAMVNAQQPAKTDSVHAAKTFLSPLDSLTLQHFQRRQAFIDSAIKSYDTTSATAFLKFKFNVDPNSLRLQIPDSIRLLDEVQHHDFVGEKLRQDQVNLGPVLDFGKAIRAANEYAKKDKVKKKPKIKDLPLPTLLEVDVLGMLWANGPATGPELFAKLDSSILVTMTADMFWQAMHRMAKRGFVSEKIVSPQLAMNFAIGPVAVPVEMSSKNRKNRVYEYEPLVDEDEMFSYLVAKNYLARTEEKASANGVGNRTNTLLTRMVVNRRKTETEYNSH